MNLRLDPVVRGGKLALLCGAWTLSNLHPLPAQEFKITGLELLNQTAVRLRFEASPNHYYILYRGDTVTNITTPADLALGENAGGGFSNPVPAAASYYRIVRVPLAQPLDTDGDGIDDLYELRRSNFLNPLNPADAQLDFDQDGLANLAEYGAGTDPATPGLDRILETSPMNGETGVAVTRETIIRFQRPLAATTTLSTGNLYAQFAGRKLLSRVELSSDRKTATLFYLENLPGSATVRVTFDGTEITDSLGIPLDADGDGLPGGVATLHFETLTVTPVPQTAVIGQVFASELMPGPGQTNSVDRPLPGVTITVDGAEETLRAITDSQGKFTLSPSPAGRFFVHIDGRPLVDLAAGVRYPDKSYYPFVGKAWEAVAGKTNNLAGETGVIYLPLVSAGTLQPVSLTTDTTITFPASVLASNPALTGVSLTVPANSLFSDNGIRGGKVGIAPVPADRLPGPLPSGLEMSMVITVQTDGALNFDRPAPICFPNLPDPVLGVPLPAGSKQALISFNHKKGVWEGVGSMTVSADGKFVCTDPGAGILQPGWHGVGPAPQRPPPPPECELNADVAMFQTSAKRQIERGLASEALSTEATRTLRRAWFIPGLDACFQRCDASLTDCLNRCQHEDAAQAERDRLDNDLLDGVARDGIKKYPAGHPALKELKDSVQQQNRQVERRRINRHQACLDFCDSCFPESPAGPAKSGVERTQSQTTVIGSPGETLNRLLDQRHSILGQLDSLDQLVLDKALSEMEELTRQAEALVGGNLRDYLVQIAMQSERAIAAATQGTAEEAGNAPAYPILYQAMIRRPGGLFFLRGQTEPLGQYSIFVPRDGILLQVALYDPKTRQFGTIVPNLRPEALYALPRITLFPLEASAEDFDRDGLPDAAEDVVGTDPFTPDTDGDGIADGAELDQGTNPLDGKPTVTGIIASAPSGGNAVDLCVQNDIAVVANGEAGITVFSVTDPFKPVRLAQLDTPGNAQAVACAGSSVAVADGQAGLAIVDLSDPSAPRMIRQVNLGTAQAVAAAGGIVYVGTSAARVYAVDLATGTILDSLPADSQIEALSLAKEYLYALTGSSLLIFDISSGLNLVSKTNVSGFPSPLEIGRKLFVGNDLAYAGYFTGYSVYSVSNAAAPILIGSPSTTQLAIHDLAANGSGLLLASTSFAGEQTLAISSYDAADPRDVTRFLTSFDTPGLPRALSIYNGLAYVADGPAGLQVLNYLPYDNQGVPPRISLSGSFPFNPPQAEAGNPLRLTANVSDDVQVRNVEFYLDGVKAVTDGDFPFEHRFNAPVRAGTNTTFKVRAKATDTGGNFAWSEEITVALLPDTTPPAVRLFTPRNNDVLPPESLTSLSARFTEPVDARTISSRFKLFSAGADTVLGTSDDLPVNGGTFSFRDEISTAFLSFTLPLPPDFYRIELASGVVDLAGITSTTNFTSSFRVFLEPIAFEQTVTNQFAAPLQVHTYRFEASGGEQVRIVTRSEAGVSFRTELLDARGQLVWNDVSPRPETTLTNPGIYSVVITASSRGEPGHYYVRLQRLNPPPGAVGAGFEQTVTTPISGPLAIDAYRFQAAGGEQLRIMTLGRVSFFSASPAIELFDERGKRLANNSCCGFPLTLDVRLTNAGAYYVLVTPDEASGTYQFRLQRLNPPPGAVPLVFEETITPELSGRLEIDAYTFQAAAGDRVRFLTRHQPGVDTPSLELFDPAGRRLAQESCCGYPLSLDTTLTNGGAYYLLVMGQFGSTTGPYDLRLQRLNPPPGAIPISFAQTITNQLSLPLESDAYTFQAPAAGPISVMTRSETSLDAPVIELFDGTGKRLAETTCCGNPLSLVATVPGPGAYYLLIRGSLGAAAGNYTVTLSR